MALPTEFTLTKRIVDLLIQVGPNRLLHVGYARRATSDLVPRMLIYRGLVMQILPKIHVTQHIVVLGEGVVSGHDEYPRNDFAVNLRVHYLRDAEVDVLVQDVNFAPLAILKPGDPAELDEVAARVVGAIRKSGSPRSDELLDFSVALATITSSVAIVEKAMKEAHMTVESIAKQCRETEFGQLLLQEGRQEGRNEGRDEGRESMLMARLAERFGRHESLPDLAHRLALWPDSVTALHAITTAAGLEELAQAEAPEPEPE